MAYLKNFELVSVLKQQIQQKSCKVPKSPGGYRWWFTKDDAQLLLKPFGGKINWSKIQMRTFDDKPYYALYVGISKNLYDRLKWHIFQKHSQSAVKSGYLSTLRQTVSALLGIDQTKSGSCVSAILERCYWEWWDTMTSPKVGEKEERDWETMPSPEIWEREELMQNEYYYPLNLQNNQSFPKELQKELSRLRKNFKK